MNRQDRVETNMWYFDNRASSHMTRDWVKFKELDENLIGSVKFDNRSILFQCKNSDQHLLTKVYYIRSLKSNIINQMNEEGSKVERQCKNLKN